MPKVGALVEGLVVPLVARGLGLLIGDVLLEDAAQVGVAALSRGDRGMSGERSQELGEADGVLRVPAQ